MTPSKPPAIASWLLEHSGTDAAIVGDILEEFAKGQTATWFWKQAIVAASPVALCAFRWLGVVPLTVVAVGLELWLRWKTGFPALPASFIMGLTFVRVGASVAPRLKDSVARIALSVLTVSGVLFAFMNSLLGFQFIPYFFWMGTLAALGGIAGYFSAGELRKIFWREIDLDWLGGLTRPRQAPGTTH
jgi:hypothetical protein